MTSVASAYQHPDVESLDRDGMRALQAHRLAELGERLALSCPSFAR